MPEPAALRPGISVVVPVFNSEKSLAELTEGVRAALSELQVGWELVLVDDCSRDRSWQVVQELVATGPEIRGIALSRNYGQHNALLAGIRAARYSQVVTIDDDLQNPPDQIPMLVQALGEELDVVYGVPTRQEHPLARRLASRLTKLVLAGAMGAETAANISSFRVFRTRLRDGFSDFHGATVNLDVLLTWSTRRFGVVRVQHEDRRFGRTNYTLLKLTAHALDMVTGFSTLPLRLASLTGFTFTLFGFVTLMYVVGRVMFQHSVPGFPFLASMIAIFSGAQLFALGIIGEYLARMHTHLTARPPFVIREITGGGPG